MLKILFKKKNTNKINFLVLKNRKNLDKKAFFN